MWGTLGNLDLSVLGEAINKAKSELEKSVDNALGIDGASKNADQPNPPSSTKAEGNILLRAILPICEVNKD